MNCESKYKKDKNKDYRFDWENLSIGDYVFTDSNVGFCSGGLSYGVGNLVIEINEDEIITKDSYDNKEKWDRKTRNPKQPPLAYYLGAFQSNNK